MCGVDARVSTSSFPCRLGMASVPALPLDSHPRGPLRRTAEDRWQRRMRMSPREGARVSDAPNTVDYERIVLFVSEHQRQRGDSHGRTVWTGRCPLCITDGRYAHSPF